MSEVTIKSIDEVDPYRGPGELEGIEFRPVGRALGVTAWGMNVLDLAPGATTYPAHDHGEDGQEEVYLVLEGDATLRAHDKDWRLERRRGPRPSRCQAQLGARREGRHSSCRRSHAWEGVRAEEVTAILVEAASQGHRATDALTK
jgi:hypothetical protein